MSLILFSPVNAVVRMNGVPVVSAKVVRTYNWRWGNKQGSDEVITDKNGAFYLNKLTGFSMTAWLPHEPFITQSILVHYNGIAHKVWECDKRDYALNGELNGREINILFQLDFEKRRINNICSGQFILSNTTN